MNKIRKILVILLILIMWGRNKSRKRSICKSIRSQRRKFCKYSIICTLCRRKFKTRRKILWRKQKRNHKIIWRNTWKISNKLFKHNILWKIPLKKHISTRRWNKNNILWIKNRQKFSISKKCRLTNNRRTNKKHTRNKRQNSRL